jgi:hypothetical protein
MTSWEGGSMGRAAGAGPASAGISTCTSYHIARTSVILKKTAAETPSSPTKSMRIRLIRTVFVLHPEEAMSQHDY